MPEGVSAEFVNASQTGEIPSFNGDEKARATDFANYFCSYAQLYHQKQMLVDHVRMAAYHSAIAGNANIFKDKVVMDVGTGSGILAAWAAKAGARRVYAIEYTDMSKHAETIMKANEVDHIVTVIKGAVEDIELPDEGFDGGIQCVDIIVSEWMGYFLLRESMLDSLIRARDKFLKPLGLMFPSHCTMYIAPITDEEERYQSCNEYGQTMQDWTEFVENTKNMYGVDMSVLETPFEREQKEYYLLSSKWAELQPNALLAESQVIKELDLATCTIEDSKGIHIDDEFSSFDFDIDGGDEDYDGAPVSGFAGWFTSHFKSRTDEDGLNAPKLNSPALLNTGPEAGYTHWGQQVFHLLSSITLLQNETLRIRGSLELMRTKENARLYNCRIKFKTSRRKSGEPKNGDILMESKEQE
eukprot:CAMPEP_0116073834 /NCGR_PEP_ID=MMETSP0322-20121206/15525_1 /TAXON_ID=163516 /ORGANISM="Leptocylindrus danicus var. apora, Strain B651" /LENGTH=412 /DNA_ID=CAMNT_0003563277 /DNA_START=82 /DNA_END=1320 /DNA_ORIENTATION=+